VKPAPDVRARAGEERQGQAHATGPGLRQRRWRSRHRAVSNWWSHRTAGLLHRLDSPWLEAIISRVLPTCTPDDDPIIGCVLPMCTLGDDSISEPAPGPLILADAHQPAGPNLHQQACAATPMGEQSRGLLEEMLHISPDVDLRFLERCPWRSIHGPNVDASKHPRRSSSDTGRRRSHVHRGNGPAPASRRAAVPGCGDRRLDASPSWHPRTSQGWKR